MQDYISLAEKNGVELLNSGACQFCGSKTKRGIHECLEIFNFGFESVDYSDTKNHIYRFLTVDSHCLQHPEIHGRWNNHFHLTRLHLILKFKVEWTYELSPKLSAYLNKYKLKKQDEYLLPPELMQRGTITATEILAISKDVSKCKLLIKDWAEDVYRTWEMCHNVADIISLGFLKENRIK